MSRAQGMTFIGVGTRLEGELVLESAALVAGELHGRIRSTGQIKIEPDGLIDGELDCHELKVCGTFRGKLCCHRLVIVSGGVVEGEVASNEMEIFDGGQFLGSRTRGPQITTEPELSQPLLQQGLRPGLQKRSPKMLPEGRPFPLKSAAAIGAVVLTGVLAWTQTGFSEAIATQWQSLTAPSSAVVSIDADEASGEAQLNTSAQVAKGADVNSETDVAAAVSVKSSVESGAVQSADAADYQEHADSMDAASALLLGQSPLESQVSGDDKSNLGLEGADATQQGLVAVDGKDAVTGVELPSANTALNSDQSVNASQSGKAESGQAESNGAGQSDITENVTGAERLLQGAMSKTTLETVETKTLGETRR